MQVRVFESTDMASALKMVRKELGPDALILSTRTLRSGKLGILGKPMIEITAAIDSNWPQPEEPALASRSATAPRPPSPPAGRAVREKRLIDTTVGANDLSFADIPVNPPDGDDGDSEEVSQGASAAGRGTGDEALRGEVDELKGLVQQLVAQLGTSRQEESGQMTPGAGRQLERLPFCDPIGEMLRSRGVNQETAATICALAREQLGQDDLADQHKARRFVLRTIEGLIDVKPPLFKKRQNKQRLIALIGPTGVGKTTTLAKLAAHYLAGYSNSIALITIDTYRIAAVEQLKVYGEIMHLPVDVVISPEQLEKSIRKFSDKSLILIDTAGRSPRDSLSLEDLKSFLRPHRTIEKHLVISAATREQELLDTISHFGAVGIDRTIFTKVDECMKTGVILNVQLQHRAPLSYITNGQRVPEDLLQITRRSVAELILSHHEGMTHD
ncbi:MAG: flagellar biosynthesis protein FlhF [Desulfopila sp.]